jgi:membrane protein DedA with SNARE-associated domain
MDHSPVMQAIIEYRYWILIPLSFVEGPIVAFFAGTLASLGYFNIYALGAFFLVRDIAVDLACYYLGVLGANTRWINKVVRRMGVTDDHLAEVRALWHNHPGKTMFISKLSYGVAAGFIVVAGLVKMDVKKFFTYGAAVAVAHYGLLLVLGYFFGVTFGSSITGILENIPYVVAGFSVLAIVYVFFRRYMNRRLIQAEAEAAREISS